MSEVAVARLDQAQRKPPSGLLEPLDFPRPPAEGDDLPPDRFINRERSWLDFNARVLALAQDTGAPLLERAKFLAIFANNLDEFYMVRVAGLMRREATRLSMRSADGLSVREQLALISKLVSTLMECHAHCFTDDVMPALAAAGISLLHWDELSPDAQS